MADCLISINQLDQAQFYFQSAIESDPGDTNTLFKYGYYNESCGNYDVAEEYYLKSLESDPFHSNCLTIYADFLASCRKNYDVRTVFYISIIVSIELSYSIIPKYPLFFPSISLGIIITFSSNTSPIISYYRKQNVFTAARYQRTNAIHSLSTTTLAF